MKPIATERETLLSFPERFPIKIFGYDNPDFIDAVTNIIERHVAGNEILERKSNESSKGNYRALTITIMAQNQKQLDAIYQDLTQSEFVKMAL